MLESRLQIRCALREVAERPVPIWNLRDRDTWRAIRREERRRADPTGRFPPWMTHFPDVDLDAPSAIRISCGSAQSARAVFRTEVRQWIVLPHRCGTWRSILQAASKSSRPTQARGQAIPPQPALEKRARGAGPPGPFRVRLLLRLLFRPGDISTMTRQEE